MANQEVEATNRAPATKQTYLRMKWKEEHWTNIENRTDKAHNNVFGGLVWILVASTRVFPDNPLGWVMFVSVFCFVGTTLWFFIFLCGGNKSTVWPSVDVAYHFLAVVFYLSASVTLAYVTILKGWGVTIAPGNLIITVLNSENLKIYRLDIAAVVMSYAATLLYFLHAIFSAYRWRRSKVN